MQPDDPPQPPSSASVHASGANAAHIARKRLRGNPVTQPEYLRDCAELASMDLRAKYPAEANSHRAMLSRQKRGALVAPSLLLFKDFLRHAGPRPKSGYTIDRLNHNDPEYAPGKIAWRSKADQTRNRSNTVFLRDADGTKHSLAEWSILTDQSPDTLYSRRRRGWPDVAVIHGLACTPAAPSVPALSIWPKGYEAQWEAGYRRGAWKLCGRRELRAEFLLRICRTRYRESLDAVEEVLPPGVEGGPKHSELFRNVEGWGRELRRAAALLAQPGYREPKWR